MLLPHLLPTILSLSATSWALQDTVFAQDNDGLIHLRSNGSHPARFIIDHGHDVNGYTTFHVVRATGNTSDFVISHSEAGALLNLPNADGPVAMAAAQNTYRVKRYPISKSNETHTDRLLQGGVRWQQLTLSSAGELVLSRVGMTPSGSVELQGSFECSNQDWNDIWSVGAQTAALSMVVAKSVPEFWQLHPDGAFIESGAPQPYTGLEAQALTAYDMEFDVRPVVGGFSFKVLSDTLGVGIYIWVNIANSTISAFSGSTEFDTLLTSVALNTTTVSLNQWSRVETSVDLTNISVSINQVPVLEFTQTSAFYGSFGIGAADGQSALFTNMTVTSAGSEIYSSNLTSNSTLDDFLVGTNPLNAIVDGARRDRIAYAGDLDVAARTVAASNFQLQYINDSLRLLSSNQLAAGYFVPSVKIQQPPRESLININMTGLIGYSWNLLSAMGEYYMVSGDIAAAKAYAPAATRMLDWSASQTLANGLFNLSEASFGGDWNYYDPAQSGVVTKFNVVYALALQEIMPMLAAANVNTTKYQHALENLRVAIDRHLYSDSLGAYFISDNITNGIAQDANAMAILANVPQGNHSKSGISGSMAKQLFVAHGALPFSNTTTEFSKLISPYASSYHLRAAFAANDSSSASYLLNHLWLPMTRHSNANYSGCFWETLHTDGTPGLGDGTSLCHAWSSGPTESLSRYVLGIQPVAPGFAGWRVVPQSMGLRWAKGTQPTPHGDISVQWRVDGGLVGMKVTSPAGTNGTISLPVHGDESMGNGVVTVVNGCVVAGSTFEVRGGEVFELTQYRM